MASRAVVALVLVGIGAPAQAQPNTEAPTVLAGRSDYPPGAAAAGDSGVALVEYGLLPTGRVSNCRVVESSGRAALDEASCAIVSERLRTPPSPPSAVGRPARRRVNVRWEDMRSADFDFGGANPIDPERWTTPSDYPREALRRGMQGRTTIAYDITEAGRAENCRVTASSGARALDDATCPLLTRRGRFWPARDESGAPRRSSGRGWFDWRLPD